MAKPRARIMVVEDDHDLAEGLREILSPHYDVLTANDAPDAVALLEAEAVDLILLDLILQRGNGFQVMEALKGSDAPSVLLMSGIGSEADLQKYDSVIVGRLDKPFQLNTVYRKVREALNGLRETPAMQHRGQASILLVDDDPILLEGTATCLKKNGYKVRGVANGDEALDVLTLNRFDAVVTDWILPKFSGVELLRRIKALWPGLPVIVVSGYATGDLSVHATAEGAADILTKPLSPRALANALEKCLHVAAPTQPVTVGSRKGLHASPRARSHYTMADIIGTSISIRRAKEELACAAATDFNVLILGETGTGKEVFARSLHEASGRAGGPFVAVNAAAIPETLLEAELFGYASGAFTGASREGRIGKFQHAHKGTLFLDEIGDLPLQMQAKILRVLQGEVDVVAGATELVDVRLVAATNRDLVRMVKAGSFRSDLYYRLNVVTLRLPLLRERKEDIAEFAQHTLDNLCAVLWATPDDDQFRGVASPHRLPVAGKHPGTAQRSGTGVCLCQAGGDACPDSFCG